MTQPPQAAKDIFLAALDIEPAERAALLDDACAGDAALRRQVEDLLRVHDEPDSLLDSPRIHLGLSGEGAAPDPNATLDQPITEQPGTQIGPYKLLQEIGHGGMGVVYMAEQTKPVERRVALKIIKPGMDTHQVIARFEAERQALAMMDHPNIAKVLDAGTTESGRPYFVMELVKGIPITKYCDQQHLTPRERLELFLPVCQAVQHAHQKGIIHRDLKPSNVLIALYDDKPVPKVIDFGVAKATSQRLTEKTMFTQYGQIVGTLEYMSPEQANLNQLDIDTRSDVYSLGVLLYGLLTGVTPFDRQRLHSAAFDEMLRIIREDEPPRPSLRLSTLDTLPSVAANRHTEPKKLSALVHGELDWIVMKALDKDRTRRYETANGFANDIQRYLSNEAVVACPPSVGYRFKKFARRNKLAITTTAVILLCLVAGVFGTGWQAIRATKAERLAATDRDHALAAERDAKVARDEAISAAEKARRMAEEANRQRQATKASEAIVRRNLYAAHMTMANESWEDGRVVHAVQLLERYLPKEGEDDIRSFEWHYLWDRFHPEEWVVPCNGSAFSVVFTPDGRQLLTPSRQGTVVVREAATGQSIVELVQGAPVSAIAVSADGQTAATGDNCGKVIIWNTSTWTETFRFEGIPSYVHCVALSPDGARVAVSYGPFYGDLGPVEVELWDLTSRQAQSLGVYEKNQVHSLAFSPDGTQLATTYGGKWRLWDVTSARLKDTFQQKGFVHGVAYLPDGKSVITGGSHGAILWDLETKQRVRSFDGRGFCLAIDPAGEMLATAGAIGEIDLWNVTTGERIGKKRGSTNWIWSVAWSPDGQRLAALGRDKQVRMWCIQDSDATVVPSRPTIWTDEGGYRPIITPVAFSPRAPYWLAVAGSDNSVRLVNLRDKNQTERLLPTEMSVSQIAFSLDGALVAAATGDMDRAGSVRLWDVETG